MNFVEIEKECNMHHWPRGDGRPCKTTLWKC